MEKARARERRVKKLEKELLKAFKSGNMKVKFPQVARKELCGYFLGMGAGKGVVDVRKLEAEVLELFAETDSMRVFTKKKEGLRV